MSETQQYKLKAMAKNYAGGHRWDHLDSDTCSKAAEEIGTLRTANQRLEGEVKRLRLALTLAANRLDRLTLELPGGCWREESAEWTSQARAALSTNDEVTE